MYRSHGKSLGKIYGVKWGLFRDIKKNICKFFIFYLLGCLIWKRVKSRIVLTTRVICLKRRGVLPPNLRPPLDIKIFVIRYACLFLFCMFILDAVVDNFGSHKKNKRSEALARQQNPNLAARNSKRTNDSLSKNASSAIKPDNVFYFILPSQRWIL